MSTYKEKLLWMFVKYEEDNNIIGKAFKLNHANKILPGKSTKFRPYNIFEGEVSVGEIFQTEHKRNIFSKY